MLGKTSFGDLAKLEGEADWLLLQVQRAILRRAFAASPASLVGPKGFSWFWGEPF
jgi:hypothetical protein